jgi:hypothetical protein
MSRIVQEWLRCRRVAAIRFSFAVLFANAATQVLTSPGR